MSHLPHVTTGLSMTLTLPEMLAQITSDYDRTASEQVGTVLLRADAIVASRPDLGMEEGTLIELIETNCTQFGLSLLVSARLSIAVAAAAMDSGERQLLSACAAELEELAD